MKTLYETDFKAWLDEQIKLIRNKDFTHVDTEHLLEEMETLGSSLKTAIESHLIIILIHMIKQHLQYDRAGKSWDDSIVNARIQIGDIIEANPSLKRYPEEVFSKCYQRAMRRAAKQMNQDKRAVPSTCPWSLKDALGE